MPSTNKIGVVSFEANKTKKPKQSLVLKNIPTGVVVYTLPMDDGDGDEDNTYYIRLDSGTIFNLTDMEMVLLDGSDLDESVEICPSGSFTIEVVAKD